MHSGNVSQLQDLEPSRYFGRNEGKYIKYPAARQELSNFLLSFCLSTIFLNVMIAI